MQSRQSLRIGLILFSFCTFPAIFYYFSPVLIVTASSQGIVNGSFIVFVLLFLSALIVGRGFCGWVCPAAGCQEAIMLARKRKIRRGNWVKWLIWLPWIGSIAVVATKAGGYSSVDFFYQTTYGLSVTSVHSLIIYLSILFLLIVLPAFIFGKRSFCHHLCWMAPFMISGRWIRNRFQWASLRLRADETLCKKCKICTKVCPMSLPVETMVGRKKMECSECILCGSCVDECPENVIWFSWGTGNR